MEMGSSSLEAFGGSGSNDSPDRLKCGNDEGVTSENPDRDGEVRTGLSYTPSSQIKKLNPRSRCQVDDCRADLTGSKAYYCRHKVCGEHSKAPKAIVAGLEQRFCQQCSRFHRLTEFDQGKRSCRRRLAGHNERRRKPPSKPLPSSYSQLFCSSTQALKNRDERFSMHLASPTNLSEIGLLQATGSISRQIPDHQSTVNEEILSDMGSGNLEHSFNSVLTGVSHPYHPYPLGDVVFSGQGMPLQGSLDSSCALSLLSTQPWDPASLVPHDDNRAGNFILGDGRCPTSTEQTTPHSKVFESSYVNNDVWNIIEPEGIGSLSRIHGVLSQEGIHGDANGQPNAFGPSQHHVSSSQSYGSHDHQKHSSL